MVEVERGGHAQIDRGAAGRGRGGAWRPGRRAPAGELLLPLLLLLLEHESGGAAVHSAAAAAAEVRDRGHGVVVDPAVRVRGRMGPQGSVHGASPPREPVIRPGRAAGVGGVGERRELPVEGRGAVPRRPRGGLLQRLPVAAVVDDERRGRGGPAGSGAGFGAEAQLREQLERRGVGPAEAEAEAAIAVAAAASVEDRRERRVRRCFVRHPVLEVVVPVLRRQAVGAAGEAVDLVVRGDDPAALLLLRLLLAEETLAARGGARRGRRDERRVRRGHPRRQRPHLPLVVREEAHAPRAPGAVSAQLRAVALRVQPALEDAVREQAGGTRGARAELAELCAGRASVGHETRVAAPRFFQGVREDALGPVVRARARAGVDLVLFQVLEGGGRAGRGERG